MTAKTQVAPIPEPQQPLPTDQKLPAALLKGVLLTLAISTALFTLTLIFLAGIVILKLNIFFKEAQTSPQELVELIQQAKQTQPTVTNQYKNILILGTDQIANRPTDPVLTDSIILLSLNCQSGQLNSVSLPRDLWLEDYQTRINALYHYGLEQQPETPKDFVAKIISESTQVPIHHTLILTPDNLAEIIDLIGGITINVPIGFTDDKFPRSDVDLQTTPLEDQYETITFAAGEQVMSGELAVKYARSRHSQGDTGTDNDRSRRQQELISGIMTKLSQTETITNPAIMGRLFHYYQSHYDSSLAITQLLACAKNLATTRQINQIKLNSHSLSIFPDNAHGVLVHPDPKKYFNQWIYIIRNQDEFVAEINHQLWPQ